jgi:hypothetical protein
MITKLTLTLEDQVIVSAKKYARLKGKSLSGIVENYLKTITSVADTDATLPPKISKMMGVIKLPEDFDHKKELGNILIQKYK